MPVLVRNLEGGPTVLTHPPTGAQLEWAGRGDKDGNDVQEVSEEVLRSSDMTRVIRKGILKIVDDAAAAQAIARQGDAHRERVQAEQKASLQAIDDTSDVPIAQAKINEKGEVTDTLPPAPPPSQRDSVAVTTDSSGQPAVFSDTGTFDDEGRPILAETRVVIDPSGSELPPQQAL